MSPGPIWRSRRFASRRWQSSRNDRGYRESDLGDGHILIYVPAGPFEMGSRDGEPFEQPVHAVMLSGYWIGKFPITVAQFRTFVADTGYVTDAERAEGCWVRSPVTSATTPVGGHRMSPSGRTNPCSA